MTMFNWPEIDITRLRNDRRENLRQVMREHNVSHLVLTGFDHIRYATDYRTQIIAESFDWFAAVVDEDGASQIFAPWIDETQKQPITDLPWIENLHPMPSWAPVVGHPKTWARGLADTLRGATRVGIELIDPQVLALLKDELPRTEFVSIGAALYDARIRKTDEEIVLLEAASAVNSLGAEAGKAAAVAGVTDHDILAAVMGEMQAAGPEFLSHSLCNHRRGDGGWFAEGTILQDGDPYFFDIGVYGKHGYASDIARTGFVGGEPRKEIKDTYRKLLTAHRIGEEAAKPGVRVSEVDRAVNDYLEKEGLPRTPYAMGHGVGLRACELPTIYRSHLIDRDQVIVENSVISLEPETGLVIDGEFMLLKVEDNYVVESDGVRRLSLAGYGLDDL
ncbi:M24 family metallopeptidase [Rhodococcus opacus]|uniref:M24 family metallopeptidase n=1 Tax=Rhodococcus opacus TaxID=37919 RepID=UPI0029551223|nr:M24 family metallopeptidase [Rhodococcus opacus]MDV7087639.1 M24 family metallopeptidase [Rhodococcus opacus]